jgi:anti-sigma regulatory factor (Ser/Thr protein kinase)
MKPTLVAVDFRCADLGPVRRLVTVAAAEAGLVGRRLQGFVLAVNEITTNAVLHGGGLGRLRLWRAGHHLVCEICDWGPGLPGGRLPANVAPPAAAIGGRGLWLTRSLCDVFTLRTGRRGTTVRLGALLPIESW